MYKAIIFDLDGTIIDTLPDLSRAINQALKDIRMDYSFSIEQTMDLIGDGANVFIRRALKEKGDDEALFNKLKPIYLHYYEMYQLDHSLPYPGVVEFLTKAKEQGIKLYVITNKPDKLAKIIISEKFGEGVFDLVTGQKDGTPHKPDPTVPNQIIQKEKLDKKEILWVGDSLVDLKTADNVGVDCALTTYGYGHIKGGEKAKYIINSITELNNVL